MHAGNWNQSASQLATGPFQPVVSVAPFQLLMGEYLALTILLLVEGHHRHLPSTRVSGLYGKEILEHALQ